MYPHPTVPVICTVCVYLWWDVKEFFLHGALKCFKITRDLFNVHREENDLALCACGFPAIIAQDNSKVIEIMLFKVD